MDSSKPGDGSASGETPEVRKKGDYKEAIAFCQPFKDKRRGSI